MWNTGPRGDHLKIFLRYSSFSHLIRTNGSGDVVQGYFLSAVLAAQTFVHFFVEGIMRNISVIQFEYGPAVQEMLFKRFLYTALVALLFGGADPFVHFL